MISGPNTESVVTITAELDTSVNRSPGDHARSRGAAPHTVRDEIGNGSRIAKGSAGELADPEAWILAAIRSNERWVGMVLSHEILQSDAQLMQIAFACSLLRLLFGAGDCRQQQCGKDSDDCHHHQQLDQGESASF